MDVPLHADGCAVFSIETCHSEQCTAVAELKREKLVDKLDSQRLGLLADFAAWSIEFRPIPWIVGVLRHR